MTDTLTAPAPTGAGAVRVGRTDYIVERPSGRKASTALRLLRRVSATVKDVTKELGRFERDYAREHCVELDRVQARMRYPARPLLDDGEPVRAEDGTPVILPSPLDAMSAEDWTKAGDVLRLPMAPNLAERVGAVFDLALEDAEDELYRLLALFTFTNAEVADLKRGQRLDDALEERADTLLDDGDLTELLELAVVVGETVEDQFTRKASELGGRLGNLRRLLGIQTPQEAQTPAPAEEQPQTAPDTPQTDDPNDGQATPSTSSSRPTSPTGSDASSDGDPTTPSTPTTASSSPSANGSPASDDAPRPAG